MTLKYSFAKNPQQTTEVWCDLVQEKALTHIYLAKTFCSLVKDAIGNIWEASSQENSLLYIEDLLASLSFLCS